MDNNPTGVAHIIFGEYVFAFEVVGALLVTAALGALVLTHRQRLTPRVGQKERADARVAAGATLTPLPAPGVYARHNAMDVPAWGRTVEPLESSVPRVLRIRGQEADAEEFAARTERVCRACPRCAATRRRRPPEGARERPRARRRRDRHRPGRPVDRRRRRHRTGGRQVSLTHYLVLSTILFSIGATTVLLRRNAIIVFMGVELMLNATNLMLVTFARIHGDLTGQVLAFFVMVVAAAEVVVGLAIIVAIFRTRRSASVDDINLLKS